MPRARGGSETPNPRRPPVATVLGDSLVDLLVVLVAVVAALATFGVAAAELGTDSREGFAGAAVTAR